MKVSNKQQLDKLSNQGNLFFKVEKGEHTIRLMSDIYAVREHGIDMSEGGYRSFACPTEQHRMRLAAGVTQDNEIPPCPLCELGYPVTTSYLGAIVAREVTEFNKKGEKVTVGGDAWLLKKGPSLMGELQNLLDDDNWGRTGNYDIKITAAGDGFSRKYSVLAVSPDKCVPLNAKEQASLNTMYEKVDLDVMTTPKPYAEIKEFIDENLIDVYVPKKKK